MSDVSQVGHSNTACVTQTGMAAGSF
ncbi:MAG: hypothetical protein ACWA42_04575 [Lutibacter sp.]